MLSRKNTAPTGVADRSTSIYPPRRGGGGRGGVKNQRGRGRGRGRGGGGLGGGGGIKGMDSTRQDTNVSESSIDKIKEWNARREQRDRCPIRPNGIDIRKSYVTNHHNGKITTTPRPSSVHHIEVYVDGSWKEGRGGVGIVLGEKDDPRNRAVPVPTPPPDHSNDSKRAEIYAHVAALYYLRTHILQPYQWRHTCIHFYSDCREASRLLKQCLESPFAVWDSTSPPPFPPLPVLHSSSSASGSSSSPSSPLFFSSSPLSDESYCSSPSTLSTSMPLTSVADVVATTTVDPIKAQVGSSCLYEVRYVEEAPYSDLFRYWWYMTRDIGKCLRLHWIASHQQTSSLPSESTTTRLLSSSTFPFYNAVPTPITPSLAGSAEKKARQIRLNNLSDALANAARDLSPRDFLHFPLFGHFYLASSSSSSSSSSSTSIHKTPLTASPSSSSSSTTSLSTPLLTECQQRDLLPLKTTSRFPTRYESSPSWCL